MAPVLQRVIIKESSINKQVMIMIRRNDGYSLAELMTVIGIIALVCGIALPAAVSWVPKYKQSSAARDVMAAFEKARMLAIRNNSYVLVEQDIQINSVSISLCTDSNRNCVDPDDSRKALLSGLKTVQQYKMPYGISLKEPNSAFASLNLSSSKKFTNISRPHFRFSKEGYPVDAATSKGDLMRGSIAVSPGSKFADKLVFVSAGGNVKIKNPDPGDGELKNE
jgi:Tfp pilus assembly protein FimT